MKIQVLRAAAVVAATSGASLADRVSLNGGPGYGGGVFVATITREAAPIGGNPAPWSPFSGAHGSQVQTRTFCSEVGEFFTPGQTYFVEYAMSAKNGGSPTGSDDLGSASAWLFSRAVSNTAAIASVFGGTFNLNNSNHSRAVQEALWKMEGESYAYSGGTVGAWREALISLASTSADGSMYGVMLMRLWDNRVFNGSTGTWQYTGHRQDQFVLIPLPPAAWAGMGTIAAVIGFGYIRRRSLRSE